MRTLLYIPNSHASTNIPYSAKESFSNHLKRFGLNANKLFDEYDKEVDKCNIEIYEKIKSAGYIDKIDKFYMESVYYTEDISILDVLDAVHLPQFNEISKKAELMITEDKKSFNMHRAMINLRFNLDFITFGRGKWFFRYIENKCIKKRNKFVEQNIDKTLNNDEIGLLVFGAGHEFNFADDIQVITYDNFVNDRYHDIFRTKIDEAKKLHKNTL